MSASTPLEADTPRALSVADAYERSLVPSLFAGWATSLVELADLRPGEHVLDVACGTGIVARLAAREVGSAGSVAGLDVDPEMLRVARETTKDVAPAIEWCEGDALDMPFGDGSFDVVFCQQGLQFFADASIAVAEMRRVLAPNGRLAVGVWRGVQNGPLLAALAATLARHIDVEAIEEMGAPCPFGDPEVLRKLLVDARFEEPRLSITAETLRAGSTQEFIEQVTLASSLGPSLRRLDSAALARLIGELDLAFRPYSDEGRLSIPIAANVAVTRR